MRSTQKTTQALTFKLNKQLKEISNSNFINVLLKLNILSIQNWKKTYELNFVGFFTLTPSEIPYQLKIICYI